MTTVTATHHKLEPDKGCPDVDATVERAVLAARAFRDLDQAQVGRIVEAMVHAGVRAAGELAQLAIQEKGFGVFEDKIVKNYVAIMTVEDLLDTLGMPRTLRAAGVKEQDFLDALPELAMTVFQDLSNRTNPRMPLVSELTTLLRLGYYGKDADGGERDDSQPAAE